MICNKGSAGARIAGAQIVKTGVQQDVFKQNESCLGVEKTYSGGMLELFLEKLVSLPEPAISEIKCDPYNAMKVACTDMAHHKNKNVWTGRTATPTKKVRL